MAKKRRYVNKTVTPREGGKLLAVPSDDVANIANYTKKLNFRRDSDGELRREGWEAFRPTSDTLPSATVTDRIGERAYAPVRMLHQFADGNGNGKLVCAVDGTLYAFDYNASWEYVFEGYAEDDYAEAHSSYGWSEIATGFAREPTRGLGIPDGSLVSVEVLDQGSGITFTGSIDTLKVPLVLEGMDATTSASLVAEIIGGKLVKIDVVNKGAGYESGVFSVGNASNSGTSTDGDPNIYFGGGTATTTTLGDTALSCTAIAATPKIRIRVHEESPVRNWECVSVSGYAIFNNGYDLPYIYRSEWPKAIPLYGLRESRVASVGTIQVYDGRLVCGDIVEITQGFEQLMGTLDNYGNVYESDLYRQGNVRVNRNQYSVLWSGYNHPWLFNQEARGSMAAGSNKFKLTYPVEFNESANGFDGLINPLRSFKVGDPVYVIGAGYGDSDLVIDSDILFRAAGSIDRIEVTEGGTGIQYTDANDVVYSDFEVRIQAGSTPQEFSPTLSDGGTPTTSAILTGVITGGVLTDVKIARGGEGFDTEQEVTITLGDIQNALGGALSNSSTLKIKYYATAEYAFDERRYNELYDSSTSADRVTGEVSIDNPVKIDSIDGYNYEFEITGTPTQAEEFQIVIQKPEETIIATTPFGFTNFDKHVVSLGQTLSEVITALGQFEATGYTISETNGKITIESSTSDSFDVSITTSLIETQGLYLRQYPEKTEGGGQEIRTLSNAYLERDTSVQTKAPFYTPVYKVMEPDSSNPGQYVDANLRVWYDYVSVNQGDAAWFITKGTYQQMTDMIAFAKSTDRVFPPTSGWTSDYIKLEYFPGFSRNNKKFGTRTQLYPQASTSQISIAKNVNHEFTLNTKAVTAVTDTMMGRMIPIGIGNVFDYDLGSAYKDWVEDGSAILRMEGLENRLIVYRQGGYYQMNMTGKVNDPFTFQSRYSGPRVPDFRNSLVSVNGQYHIYAGYTGCYMVTLGQPEPKIIPALELGERFWQKVDRSEAEYVNSAHNPTTQEIFISTPDQTYALDLLTMTLSEIDACFTAMSSIRKPVDEGGQRGAGKQEEVWFVVAEHQPDKTGEEYNGTKDRSDGVLGHMICRYGLGAASDGYLEGYKLYSRNGIRNASGVLEGDQPYTSELTSGLFSFGDRFNDKNLRSYMVHVSDRIGQTPIKATVFTAYTTNGTEYAFGDEPDPIKDGFVTLSNPAVENLIPLYLRAPFFKDTIKVEGKDNPIRLIGRTFEVSGIASESANQTTNQGAQDAN